MNPSDLVSAKHSTASFRHTSHFAAVLILATSLGGCQTEALSRSYSVDPTTGSVEAPKMPASLAASETTPEPAETEASEKKDDVVEQYVAPKPGTRFTWRNNWESLPPRITYRVDEPVTIGGREYVKLTAVEGMGEELHAYYDAQNYSLKGYRDSQNKAVVTYKPVEQRYRFPLKPGDRWITEWRSKDHRKDKVQSGGGVVRVIGFEELSLPAGRYRTVKLSMPLPRGMANMRHFIWFSPKLGVTVKEQVTNGRLNWTQLLESVEMPG